MRIYSSAFDVFVGDNKIFTMDRKKIRSDKLVGSGCHRIELPADWMGKVLTLKLYAAQKSSFDILPKVSLHPNELFGSPFREIKLTPTLCVACFMGIFGALLMVGGVGGMGFAGYFGRLIFIGFFSLVIATWSICYTKDITQISMNLEVNYLIEHATIYLSPCALELLIVGMRRGKIHGWRWIGLCAILGFSSFLFIVSTFAQFFGLAKYGDFLLPFHISVVVGILFSFLPGVIYSKKDGLPDKIFAVGFALYCVTCLAEVAFYVVTRILFNGNVERYPIIPIGVLLFLLSLVFSYAVYLQKSVADRAEKYILTSIAYRDSLTGLYNRAKCEIIFDALNAAPSDFAIVSIDLDGLKKVNDTYGHQQGDELIKAFAGVLHRSFAGYGTTIRMGGDEFAIVAPGLEEKDFSCLTGRLEAATATYNNSSGQPFTLSISLGMASFSAENSDLNLLLKKADERQYEQKRVHHRTRA
jgi:diguanylate cyclase (GGDEF)-like protein